MVYSHDNLFVVVRLGADGLGMALLGSSAIPFLTVADFNARYVKPSFIRPAPADPRRGAICTQGRASDRADVQDPAPILVTGR